MQTDSNLLIAPEPCNTDDSVLVILIVTWVVKSLPLYVLLTMVNKINSSSSSSTAAGPPAGGKVGSASLSRPPRVPLRAADYICGTTSGSSTSVLPSSSSSSPTTNALPSAAATLRDARATLPEWIDFFDIHTMIHLPTTDHARTSKSRCATTDYYNTSTTTAATVKPTDDIGTATDGAAVQSTEPNTDSFSVYRTRTDSTVVDSTAGNGCVHSAAAVGHEGGGGLWFVLLHGAGHSALSWALVARLLKRNGYRSLAYDARGHGKTKCLRNAALSADNLVDDGVRLLKECFVNGHEATTADEVTAAATQVVLVGHSMGGAIASKIATSPDLPTGLVVGLVVLDAVEGIAMTALPGMRNFVKRFPSSFPKPEAAVDWSVQVGILSNIESANISIPSQIYKTSTGKWKWILDLASTEQYWAGWFKGLSEAFVSAKLPKVLMLAGEERLDKPLMIAQMQGRFQLTLLTKSGHVLEEDQPNETCEVLVNLARRIALSSKCIVVPPLHCDEATHAAPTPAPAFKTITAVQRTSQAQEQ
eukprot:Lankesteria_metandrocarpae@DN5348_c0_g1_i1.p1